MTVGRGTLYKSAVCNLYGYLCSRAASKTSHLSVGRLGI
jgi:hypothetical protein